MGAKWLNQFLFSSSHKLCMINGTFTVGASGIVTAYTGSNVTSVVSSASGVYHINLANRYNKLYNAHFTIVAATTGTYGGVNDVEICGDGTAVNQSSPVVVCQTVLAGNVANPSSGTIIYFSLFLRDSSLKEKGE